MTDYADLRDTSVLARLVTMIDGFSRGIGLIGAEANDEAAPRLRRIEQSVRSASERVRWAERAADQADEEGRDDAMRALEEAEALLATLEAAASRVQDALGRYRYATRELNAADFRSARTYLTERMVTANDYLDVAVPDSERDRSVAAINISTRSEGSTSSGLPTELPPLPAGFIWVPIDEIDLSSDDTPLVWNKVERSTMTAGAEAFTRDLMPMLARGEASVDNLIAFDRAAGRTGSTAKHPQSLENLHAVFFGTDPIAAERYPDGKYRLASGRHRTVAALELGWTHVPAKKLGRL